MYTSGQMKEHVMQKYLEMQMHSGFTLLMCILVAVLKVIILLGRYEGRDTNLIVYEGPNVHMCVPHSVSQSSTVNPRPFFLSPVIDMYCGIVLPLETGVCKCVYQRQGLRECTVCQHQGLPWLTPPPSLSDDRSFITFFPRTALACPFDSALDGLSPPAPLPPRLISVYMAQSSLDFNCLPLFCHLFAVHQWKHLPIQPLSHS